MRSPAFCAVDNETYHNAPQTVAKPDSGGVGGKSWAPIRSRHVFTRHFFQVTLPNQRTTGFCSAFEAWPCVHIFELTSGI